MRRAGDVALGALVGLGVAIVLLIVAIFVLEAAYARGWRYDDLAVAYVFQGVLVAAPIVGGWWAWVRR